MIMRSWNRAYAHMNGYFWMPCASCGEMMGGHEWLHEHWNSVPDPEYPDDPTRGVAICPDCIFARRGKMAWKKFYQDHGLEDRTEWEYEG